MEELVSLASTQPFGDGRVRLGFGFDGLYLPESVLGPLFKKVRDLGIKLITIHYLNSASFGLYLPQNVSVSISLVYVHL